MSKTPALTASASTSQLPPYMRTSSAKGKKKPGTSKTGLKAAKKSKGPSGGTSRNDRMPSGTRSTVDVTARTTAPSNSNEASKSHRQLMVEKRVPYKQLEPDQLGIADFSPIVSGRSKALDSQESNTVVNFESFQNKMETCNSTIGSAKPSDAQKTVM